MNISDDGLIRDTIYGKVHLPTYVMFIPPPTEKEIKEEKWRRRKEYYRDMFIYLGHWFGVWLAFWSAAGFVIGLSKLFGS